MIDTLLEVDNPFDLQVETPEQRHARRLDRASHCMAIFRSRSKYTGGYYLFNKPCGEYRVCPKCRAYRAKQLRERAERCIWQAMSKSACARRAYGVRVDPSEAKALIREYGKEWCFLIPQAEYTLAIVASESEIGEQLTNELVEDMNWSDLAVCPDGKKLSGKLGAKRKEEVGESDGVVTIPEVLLAGITREAEAHAEECAVRETPDLYPRTLEELQDAITTRHNAFVNQVLRHGGRVVSYSRHCENVKLSDIDWHSYNINRISNHLERVWSKVKTE